MTSFWGRSVGAGTLRADSRINIQPAELIDGYGEDDGAEEGTLPDWLPKT